MLYSAHGYKWRGRGKVWNILREFFGHNFVSGLRTLKPRKPGKPKKNLKTKNFFWKPSFSALVQWQAAVVSGFHTLDNVGLTLAARTLEFKKIGHAHICGRYAVLFSDVKMRNFSVTE